MSGQVKDVIRSPNNIKASIYKNIQKSGKRMGNEEVEVSSGK